MNTANKPALHVQQLTVSYGKTSALWDISLDVPTGVLVGIVGPNGAGKSTLMKAVLGLVKPLSGQVEFFGQPLKDVRQRVAYVPQRESVDWDFPITVRDLVLMGRYGRLGLLRRPRAADYSAVEHALRLVGMEQYANRQIGQLSGGQQQRVFLARALLQDADIYFMDEPFAGIDLTTESILVKQLQQLRAEGKTVFVVHHDLGTVDRHFDWAIVMNVRLVSCGPLATSLTSEHLHEAYGKNFALFDQAARLSQMKQTGIMS